MTRDVKLRTLSSSEKYKTIIDDVGEKRRYSRSILQWSKNDFESKKTTNGYYYTFNLSILGHLIYNARSWAWLIPVE